MTVWYPDLAFLLNSLTDLLALSATARLAGLPLRWKRLLAAAALGGLYGVICLLPPTAAANSVIFQMLVAAALIWVAFGPTSFFLRQLLSRNMFIFLMIGTINTTIDAVIRQI